MYRTFTVPNTPKQAKLKAPSTGDDAAEPDAAAGITSALMLCVGKDCAKKHPTAFDDLARRARAGGCDVDFVKCQGSCTGPTAVMHDGDRYRWFEDLAKTKARKDLVALATGASTEVSDRLATRELTGRARAKAERKLSAQLRRR